MYSAIQLTVMEPGEMLRVHRDMHNTGDNRVLAFGSYEGGELWIEDTQKGKTHVPPPPECCGRPDELELEGEMIG